MTILLGGPSPHLYTEQTPLAGTRDTGYADGLEGRDAPSPLYDRAERAAYYQGHIRGTLARIAAERDTERHFTAS